MKTQILTALLATTISLSTFAGDTEGGAGPGGGDVESQESTVIGINYGRALEMIKNRIASRDIQNQLALFVESRPFVKVDTVRYAEPLEITIRRLAGLGLAEELKNSVYVFKNKCYEQNILANGQTETIETDASTLRGVQGAEICLSSLRLAKRLAKDLSFDSSEDEEMSWRFFLDLKGLLFHENIRHFLMLGENDTNYQILENGERIKKHPFAMFATQHTMISGTLTKVDDGAYAAMSVMKTRSKRLWKFDNDNDTQITNIDIYSKNKETLSSYFMVVTLKYGKDCQQTKSYKYKLTDNTKTGSVVDYAQFPNICKEGRVEIVNSQTNEKVTLPYVGLNHSMSPLMNIELQVRSRKYVL